MSLPDLLANLQIDFKLAGEHHHAREGWVQIDCPFCSHSPHKYHLGLVERGNLSNCWRCGIHRSSDALSLITGRSEKEMFLLLRPLFDLPAPRKVKTSGKLSLPPHSDLLPQHHRYLERRGFAPSEIESLWGVKGIGNSSRLSWRLLIPIFYEGEIVSWTTRSIGNHSARYINAKPDQEKISAKSILYGLDHCSPKAILLVEGPTDVWRIGPGAAAVMGTAYTESQIEILSRFPVRYICFDREPQAQRRAHAIIDQVSVFPGETYNIILEKASDPGEAKGRELRELRSLISRQ